MQGFTDRREAGKQLARALEPYRNCGAIVVGMARGGVVVAEPIAEYLDLPLRALVVRKLGAPQNKELAIGAVSETGVRWLDEPLIAALGVTNTYLDQEIAEQVAEARRRQEAYHTGGQLQIVAGRPAIVVDDGIATGASALVAVQSVRDLGASEIILATPVASRQAEIALRPHVTQLVVLLTPEPFRAVGYHYLHFDQVSDAEVQHDLQEAAQRQSVQQ